MKKLQLLRKPKFKLEVCLALLLFSMPFAYPIHALFSETTNVISILGYEFTHNYENNQYFAWYKITEYISFCYLILWFLFHKRINRIFVFFPILIFGYLFFKDPKDFNVFTNKYIALATCLLFILCGFLKFKKTTIVELKSKNYANTFFGTLIIIVALIYICSFQNFLAKPFIDFGLFRMESQGFDDVSIMVYYVSIKALLLVPLLYWFLTETKWWKYALISPILIISMQLYNTFTTLSEDIDVIEVFQTLHFTIPLLIMLLLLAKTMEKQTIIASWIKRKYVEVESTVSNRFSSKQQVIDSSKEAIGTKNMNMKQLTELKNQLEREIARKA